MLKVLGSKETGVALENAASCAPANSKAYEDASVSEDPMIVALNTMADNVVPTPNIPEMNVMWSVTDDLLAAVNKHGGMCRRHAMHIRRKLWNRFLQCSNLQM